MGATSGQGSEAALAKSTGVALALTRAAGLAAGIRDLAAKIRGLAAGAIDLAPDVRGSAAGFRGLATGLRDSVLWLELASWSELGSWLPPGPEWQRRLVVPLTTIGRPRGVLPSLGSPTGRKEIGQDAGLLVRKDGE